MSSTVRSVEEWSRSGPRPPLRVIVPAAARNPTRVVIGNKAGVEDRLMSVRFTVLDPHANHDQKSRTDGDLDSAPSAASNLVDVGGVNDVAA
jgi:hypothetical protein